MFTHLVVSLILAVAPVETTKNDPATSPSKLTVALIGSDKNGNDKEITLEVKKLAKEMDTSKVRLIYDGGGAGIRYFFVQEFKSRGGEVVAYRNEKEKFKTPDAIPSKIFQNDSERMQQMYNDSDLFLVLPGGIETIAEMSFVIDQNATKEKALRPLVVFDINGYFGRFFQFIEFVEKQGFMDHKRLFKRSVKQEKEITKVLSQIYFESKKVKKG
jgi:predicted Rossmann-fold nucleotide-binding protein